MCLILLAHRAHPDYRLIVAANRDEWFRRPTAAAAFWDDAPDIFAGRDLEQKGTWLGVTRTGRFAALTNYRDPAHQRADAPSRGHLVSGFLLSEASPGTYLAALARDAARYNGFGLFVGNAHAVCFYSNREKTIHTLAPGVYGLSNRLLDDPWPKVRRGKERLADLVAHGVDEDRLLQLLDDTDIAPDDDLPQTGVSLEWERKLSSIRILATGYGTRSSTALLVSNNGDAHFVERSFNEVGEETGVVRERVRALAPSLGAGSPLP
jgi:uncharacterized protein with NRDE domain